MEGRCRNHPDHRQSKGVCPFCLREKLSQISVSSTASSMLTSPRYSSDSVFSNSSSTVSPATMPKRRRWRKQKTITKSKGVVAGGGGLLKKSRPTAYVLGMTSSVAMEDERVSDDGSDSGKERKEKNRRGFWYRLMGINKNNKKKKIGGKDVVVVMDQGVLLHSSAVKENTSSSSPGVGLFDL